MRDFIVGIVRALLRRWSLARASLNTIAEWSAAVYHDELDWTKDQHLEAWRDYAADQMADEISEVL